ncbi:MAG: ABC transporter ATP-binding protein [Planctomycetota bacterium]
MSDSNAPFIVLDGVSKSYTEAGRQRAVLAGIDASVDRGEFVVLLGRSGSGKSTLLNLLGGIDVAEEGAVCVDGQDLGRMSETERTRFRRARVGIVFQSFNLVPTLTVEENVRLRLDLNGVSPKEGSEVARHRLEQVGLGDRAGSFPERLSGGEQQRVAVAGALVHDPDLVLADEPTGNLDLAIGQRVVELLDDLVRTEGKTLVMATHSPDMVGESDQVLSIVEGRLARSHSEGRQ